MLSRSCQRSAQWHAAAAGMVLPLRFFARQRGAQGEGPRAGTSISIIRLWVLLCTLHHADILPPVICNFLESCQASLGHLCK